MRLLELIDHRLDIVLNLNHLPLDGSDLVNLVLSHLVLLSDLVSELGSQVFLLFVVE